MARILVIQLKRIGDFILTAPAVQALHDHVRDPEIVMLVPAGVADLAACLAPVSRVIPYQAGRMNLKAWASAIAGEWEGCLDFTGTDRSALLTQISRAKKRVGYEKFARGLRKLAYTHTSEASVRELHTVDFHLALVERYLGQPVSAPSRPPFVIPEGVRRSAATKLSDAGVGGPFAVIHAGTAREEKFWEPERWAEVATHLQHRHGLAVVLTGTGEGLERPHLERLREVLTVPFADLTGRLSLPELAAVIESSRVIAGVDSMAMHVASLFETPQVALFGPTNPFHWRARHEASRVVMPFSEEPVGEFIPKMKKGAMADIPASRMATVLDALIG